MERATLARPYAEAVAKLASAGNAWGAWSERLALLNAVCADAQLLTLAGNPAISSERVAEVVIGVCGSALGEEGANLVRLLAENKRLALLPEITTLFEDAKSAQDGQLIAHITSAFDLSPTQMAALVSRLESKFGRKIIATQSTDPDLIGGVVVQVGDEVMDASVRGGLEQLAVTLKA
ncbi:MAG: F0F1 ATP synthase subunit delta [Betaproteobacteria bacterium]|nr:F0F1 ATP synthase subunit delta [Betaproteobacteria bacterium]